MGKAQAKDLGFDSELLYDPQANYERVRGNLWDWASVPIQLPKATRTVDTPAQDAAIVAAAAP